ncbi:MAG: GPR endopeptidase [Ruminococcaceae bacterium]|nr:GPR endopeptidase [Oscillospiraceae bacterium]
MDFSTKYTVRTDLADEVLEGLREKQGTFDDGITFETCITKGVKVDTVNVRNAFAEAETGKRMGTYITVTTGEIWKTDTRGFENVSGVISDIIKSMLPKEGLCLVVCLGNSRISADALGPMTAQNLIVSRHIKQNDENLFDSLQLGECACIVPGVMGDTGAEAFELVKGAVDILRPSCAVIIDALASRNVSRLVKTVQISDTGIAPGSGVGNSRHEISRDTLGIPTVAVGVPTVVEAQTMCLDILSQAVDRDSGIYNYIEEKMPQNIGRFFVCPKESDKITRSMAKLIGYSLNAVFHKNMTISEMDEFLS